MEGSVMHSQADENQAYFGVPSSSIHSHLQCPINNQPFSTNQQVVYYNKPPQQQQIDAHYFVPDFHSHQKQNTSNGTYESSQNPISIQEQNYSSDFKHHNWNYSSQQPQLGLFDSPAGIRYRTEVATEHPNTMMHGLQPSNYFQHVQGVTYNNNNNHSIEAYSWQNSNCVANTVVNCEENLTSSTTKNTIKKNSIESQSDSNNKTFACPKCSKAFKRGDHLKRHLLSVHDRDHPYHCGECQKGFAMISNLVKHCTSSHIDKNIRGHLCVWCGIRFDNILEFEKHASLLHEKQDMDYMKSINISSRTFSCLVCHKTVSSEKNLQRHIKKMHSENEDSKQLCQKCSIVFNSISEIRAHNEELHNEQLTTEDKQSLPSKKQKLFSAQLDMNHDENNSLLETKQDGSSYTQQKPFANQLPQYHQHPSVENQIKKDLHSHNEIQHNATSNILPERNLLISKPSQVFENQKQISNQSHFLPTIQLSLPASNQHFMSNKESCHDATSVKQGSKTIVMSKSNQQTYIIKNIESKNISVCTFETSSVSEALSMAMKTLSDFAYEDLPAEIPEYLPAGPSVFQSSSPLPNFHYPKSVQLADPTNAANSLAFTNSQLPQQSVCVASPPVPFSEVSSFPVQSHITTHHLTNTKEKQTGLRSLTPQKHTAEVTEQTSSGNAKSSPISLQAKRGRPKKSKGSYNEHDDDYGAQTMILKQDGDGTTILFTCTVCNETYKGIDSLMQHVEGVHLNLDPHECCICHKRFAQAGNVKRHIRFVHLRERPFRCRDCDCVFDRLCYLQRHMRTHLDTNITNASYLNPCDCPECGKRCLTAHHLLGHMQRKHFAKNKQHSEDLMQKYEYLFRDKLGLIGIDDIKKCCKRSRKLKKNKLVTNNSSETTITCQHDNSDVIKENNDPKPPNSDVQEKQNMHTQVSENVQTKVNADKAVEDLNSSVSSLVKSNKKNTNTAFRLETLHRRSVGDKGSKGRIRGNLKVDKRTSGKSSAQSKLVNYTSSRLQKRNRLQKLCMYRNCIKFNRQRKVSRLQYKCQYCPSCKFSSLSLLKSHLAVVHHSVANRHICLICGRSYSVKALLVAHIKKMHALRN